MIFLKKIYAEGFKSFAKPTIIDFKHNMTGIIGPNGSGKSNIVDALKWIIGEQSMKQLRGNDKTNLIFMGSVNLSEAPYAFVEMTFNNQNRILSIDADEVKISRKLIRKSGESIYTLNEKEAKLKDIQEIFLDTGLSKGSLGIISQGTVNWFSECKPEERRKIFEEASGIGKYSKRKAEAIKSLETTETNFQIISQKLTDITKEVNKLQKQADKYHEYQEKFKKLKEYDLTIKAKKYTDAKKEFDESSNAIIRLNDKRKDLEANIKYYDDLYNQKRQLVNDKNKEIEDLQTQQTELTAKLRELEHQAKVHEDNLNQKLSSGSIEEKIKAYKQIIVSDEQLLIDLEKRKNEAGQKIESLTKTIDETKTKIFDINQQLIDINKKLSYKEHDLENLENMAKRDDSKAISTLLKNKEGFPGLVDTVVNLIKVPNKYEVCISTALGSSAKNIVCLNESVAKIAIKFIKENKLGFLTFIPLDKIVPKSIDPTILSAIKAMNGFVGIASDLIKFDPTYKKAIDSLLGNIIIADNLDNATNIATAINQRFKVITLDGDIKNVGGSLAGGHRTHNNITFNIEDKINGLKTEIEQLTNQKNDIQVELSKLEYDKKEAEDSCSNAKVLQISTIDNINIKTENLKRNQYEYNDLLQRSNRTDEDDYIAIDNINSLVSSTDAELRMVINSINASREIYNTLNTELDSINTEKNNAHFELNSANDQIASQNSIVYKNNSIITNIEDSIIKDYNVSVEVLVQEYLNNTIDVDFSTAERIALTLKAELKELGHVDENVLKELQERHQEYDKIKYEYDDALKAYNDVKDTIIELDAKAVSDFKKTIKSVNENIPKIFNELFGGGHCEIKLTEPDNVLESGIDIIVQPKGKTVKYLGLLSGGEKTLVALTVLFAILNSAKFPLIVLDEAEAALDELNVEIFANIIKKYSENTQFIVITHRSGTMKLFPALYGITMQDKGVSTVILTSYDALNMKED